MPSTAGSALSRSTSASSSASLVSAGRRCSKLSIPASRGRLALGADVDGRGGVVADQHDGQPGRAAGGGAEACHFGTDRGAKAGRGRLAVDRLRGHIKVALVSSATPSTQLADHLDREDEDDRRQVDPAEIGQ